MKFMTKNKIRKMKLWDKNIDGKEAEHAKIIEKFTVGNDRDFGFAFGRI